MVRRASSPVAASTASSATGGGGTSNPVAEYTHAGAFALNAALRAGDASSPLVRRLDRAFGTLPAPVDVRRVVSGDGARRIIDAARTHVPYTDPGFMSTQKVGHGSLEDAIEDFAPGSNRRDVVVIEARLPRGARAIDVGNPAGGLGYDQGEVLLPRGTQVFVGDMRRENGVRVYRATLRPPR